MQARTDRTESKTVEGRFEWVVVGGGIHGTYVARELLDAGVSREDIVILDTHGKLLGSFRRKARACGMETLRSNYVQHVGPTPFGLERFAETHEREDELVPTRNSQPRPTVDLFLDYADHVVDRFGLAGLVREATVTGIDRDDSLVVQLQGGTSHDQIRATRVVLAVGQGDRYRRPEWAVDQSRVEHVWDTGTSPAETVETDETVWVVGGGTTAGQVATSMADHVERVTLCTRHPLEEALREADPRWLNWRHIERELHSLPPGSKARYERVRDARNDATMPQYLLAELRSSETLAVCHDQIIEVFETDDGLLVSCEHGTDSGVDRIVLATGFEPVSDHPLVRSAADSLSLARGYRGLPVLDDETLAWQTQNGDNSNIFVTGALAATTVGAFAGNVPGARRAAERLVDDATVTSTAAPLTS